MTKLAQRNKSKEREKESKRCKYSKGERKDHRGNCELLSLRNCPQVKLARKK